jgi:hypothetical protein
MTVSTISKSFQHLTDTITIVFSFRNFGPITKESATPHFVLKARRSKDHHSVYINICSSKKVPYLNATSVITSQNEESENSTGANRENESADYMVGSLQSKRLDVGNNISNEFINAAAVDVIVNPQLLHLSDKDDTDNIQVQYLTVYHHR